MVESIDHYLDFMLESAYLAGKITLAYFQGIVDVNYKEDETPVTIADRLAEELIRSRIEKKFPKHAIVGEEYGVKDHEFDSSGKDSHRWIIDPIDGTKSFIRGVPLYAVLIGLEIEGEVQAGCAYFPVLNDMIYAARNLGCRWNGRQVFVSGIDRLDQAFVACTTPGSFGIYGRGEAWQRIQQKTYFQAGWGDAYGYALVSTGRIEIMLDPVMNVWDAAPFSVILQEAGGYFGDWQGTPTIYGNEGLATNLALLPQVVELLR
jgi:histidinol-phosphatase